jgi:hypothetical protein
MNWEVANHFTNRRISKDIEENIDSVKTLMSLNCGKQGERNQLKVHHCWKLCKQSEREPHGGYH